MLLKDNKINKDATNRTIELPLRNPSSSISQPQEKWIDRVSKEILSG